MLKLTYTENSFTLEHLTSSLEDWVTTRVLLALRSATTLCVEPSTAAFLLPADLPYLADLAKLARGDLAELLCVTACDAETVEVSLEGTWLGSSLESEDGLFVCALGDRAEVFVYQLWQEAQFSASVMND